MKIGCRYSTTDAMPAGSNCTDSVESPKNSSTLNRALTSSAGQVPARSGRSPRRAATSANSSPPPKARKPANSRGGQ